MKDSMTSLQKFVEKQGNRVKRFKCSRNFLFSIFIHFEQRSVTAFSCRNILENSSFRFGGKLYDRRASDPAGSADG